MDQDKDKTVNFVIVPTMTSRELVCLLLEKFPDVRDIVCSDEDCFELSTIVYDSFAQIVLQRADDPGFMQAVASFIDELAESKGALVYEVLMSCLLEGIAQNEQVARMISRMISPRSRSLLHEVERDFYRRTPSE